MLLLQKMSEFCFVTGRNQMIPINFNMHFSYLNWKVFCFLYTKDFSIIQCLKLGNEGDANRRGKYTANHMQILMHFL